MNSLFPFTFPFQCSKNVLFGIQAPAMGTSGRFIFSRLKKEQFFVNGVQLLGVSVVPVDGLPLIARYPRLTFVCG